MSLDAGVAAVVAGVAGVDDNDVRWRRVVVACRMRMCTVTAVRMLLLLMWQTLRMLAVDVEVVVLVVVIVVVVVFRGGVWYVMMMGRVVVDGTGSGMCGRVVGERERERQRQSGNGCREQAAVRRWWCNLLAGRPEGWARTNSEARREIRCGDACVSGIDGGQCVCVWWSVCGWFPMSWLVSVCDCVCLISGGTWWMLSVFLGRFVCWDVCVYSMMFAVLGC